MPHSLQQTRGVWEAIVKIGPACTKVAAGIGTGLGISEVVYPMAVGGPNNIT